LKIDVKDVIARSMSAKMAASRIRVKMAANGIQTINCCELLFNNGAACLTVSIWNQTAYLVMCHYVLQIKSLNTVHNQPTNHPTKYK